LPAGELAAGEVELSGTGEPGSELEIVADGQVVGITTIGSDGSWQTTIELPDAGEYEVQVRTVDESGASLAETQPATLQIGEAGAETAATGDQSQTPTGQAYIVQADDWLSKIADKFYGDMFAYQAIVDATNAKAGEDSSFTLIADPNRIEIGQKLWIPASP
jgi:nucleoid-associated protein YgaU